MTKQPIQTNRPIIQAFFIPMLLLLVLLFSGVLLWISTSTYLAAHRLNKNAAVISAKVDNTYQTTHLSRGTTITDYFVTYSFNQNGAHTSQSQEVPITVRDNAALKTSVDVIYNTKEPTQSYILGTEPYEDHARLAALVNFGLITVWTIGILTLQKLKIIDLRVLLPSRNRTPSNPS